MQSLKPPTVRTRWATQEQDIPKLGRIKCNKIRILDDNHGAGEAPLPEMCPVWFFKSHFLSPYFATWPDAIGRVDQQRRHPDTTKPKAELHITATLSRCEWKSEVKAPKEPKPHPTPAPHAELSPTAAAQITLARAKTTPH
ncbi:uncharacterized protein TM35_000101830 [Trypanosoma theileri]|uniref:Uncharacterized protein n=1 Tax=Trypanosoma theileri TaxID=67003 RepID=A0A1X0NZ11_9TRYP|nr:uncharacterized protein TM35_000101830 [Trypanosoma theileri]ORC89915.1 hypothetical protein TM35_000101830 [Trypanosoma theileri]